MTKFTESDIRVIDASQARIQKLQDDQIETFDILKARFPDLLPNEECRLWDYCFNNSSRTLTLDDKGFRIESVFKHD